MRAGVRVCVCVYVCVCACMCVCVCVCVCVGSEAIQHLSLNEQRSPTAMTAGVGCVGGYGVCVGTVGVFHNVTSHGCVQFHFSRL